MVAYAFGLSLIYIYTYWDLFGIDVLQWVDFGDVIELGLAQLTVLFVGFAFCALMIWVVIAPILGWPFLIEELDESDKALRMRALDYVVGAISFVGGMVLLLGTTAPLWGAFLLSAAVITTARRAEWLRARIPDRRLRTLVVSMVGCAPIIVFGWALRTYIGIETGARYAAVDAAELRTAGATLPSGTDGELKILGIVHHDRLFVLKDSLRVEERSVIAVPLANLSSIQIRQGTQRVGAGFWATGVWRD